MKEKVLFDFPSKLLNLQVILFYQLPIVALGALLGPYSLAPIIGLP